MASPLFVYPSNASTSPLGTLALKATGGSGSGYTWALTTSESGGSVVGSTYTAGTRFGYADTVTVTDSDGNTATRDVRVLEGPTLATLRETCRRRSDMVNSNFIEPDEWNSYIDASYKELYDLLVTKYGDNYEVQSPFEFVTDGSEQYPLPPDFYKLLGVDLQLNVAPGSYATLKSFNFGERNRYAIPNMQAFYGIRTNLRYRVVGNFIRFIPQASPGQTVRLWYVPRPSSLTVDTDVIDGVSGWEEYVITDVCIKALTKEESDPMVFGLQKAALIKRIEDSAANRDLANPATVSDTAYQDMGREPGWPSGGGW